MLDPNPAAHVLCEPAQSKRTWTFNKKHFVWKFIRKMQHTIPSMSIIQHRAFALPIKTLQCGHTVWGIFCPKKPWWSSLPRTPPRPGEVLGCGRPFRFPDDSGLGLFVTWADEVTGALHPSSVDALGDYSIATRDLRPWRIRAVEKKREGWGWWWRVLGGNNFVVRTVFEVCFFLRIVKAGKQFVFCFDFWPSGKGLHKYGKDPPFWMDNIHYFYGHFPW